MLAYIRASILITVDLMIGEVMIKKQEGKRKGSISTHPQNEAETDAFSAGSQI